MNNAQAIHAFWSGFGLSVYDQNSVPSDASFPRITYSVADSDFDRPVELTASLWYRDPSWQGITLKEQQISNTIGRGGKIIVTESGGIWIRKGVPFAQRMGDQEDDMVKRMVLNISVEFIN